MLDKLQAAQARFDIVSQRLADPDVLADRERYTKLAREHGELQPLVTTTKDYTLALAQLDEAREVFQNDDDPDVRELAREEIAELEARTAELETTLQRMLIPKDPLDDKNIILEIRAGTGGDEAALFAGDLLTMYQRFASNQGWSLEILSASPGTVGGFKEVIGLLEGQGVYSFLKFEAGVHRAQRVPATESQGRIHTSACTVAVLPEAEDVDIHIDPSDLSIDTYRSSGAGGQHVNVTDSAVRITHIPTGIVVTSQDERSQHKNKARAMTVLRSRILDQEREKQQQERADSRRSMVGTGDRSERIRTYNYPQNRITDHRIGLTLHNLDRTLGSGELLPFIEAIQTHVHAEQLASSHLPD